MPNARELLSRKDATSLATLPPSASALEAATLMNERHIGSLVVLEDGVLVGIFTERDLLRRVVAEQRDPAATTIVSVMTAPVTCATPGARLAQLRTLMTEQRIRHVPVVEEDAVIGMLSIGDLNKAQSEVNEQTIAYLEQFISVA